MDEKYPYPTLLVIDWAFDNKLVLNLNKRRIPFEKNDLHMEAPLDPIERESFTKIINDDVQISIIDNIYNSTAWKEDYINPTNRWRAKLKKYVIF